MTIASYSDTVEAAKARLGALWTLTPIQWEGDAKFTRRKDEMWLRLSARPSETISFGIGGRATDTAGYLHLDVFGPTAAVAHDQVGKVADQAATVFRFFSTGGLHFQAPLVRPGTPEPGFHSFKVLAPYRRIDGVDPGAGMAVYAMTTETQAGHGFSRGQFLRFTSGGWALAQADADDHLARAVVALVRDSSRFDVAYLNSGLEVELPGHGMGTAGQILYLSQGTPGAGTAAAPTAGIVQVVGQVKNGDRVMLGAVQAVAL